MQTSSSRKMLQIIPSFNCNITNAKGCIVSGGVDVGPFGAGWAAGALALDAIPPYT